MHVESPDGELKVWLEPRVEVAQNRGVITTEVEVASISKHGFWLCLGGRELFVSFKTFSWFADAPVSKIVKVRWPSPDHLYWPDLDVDLSVESIEHPERFPLRFNPSKTTAG